jgi:uncharacterized protein YerC
MRRYHFLQQKDVFEALDRVRDALLAARDGNDVEQIMNGILTFDERMKIGRRILVAEYLIAGFKMEEIKDMFNVGRTTISQVTRKIGDYERCFDLLRSRNKKVNDTYGKKRYRLSGGSTKIFKTKEYTGFKRKDVKR